MTPLPPGIRSLFRIPWRGRDRIRADVAEEIAFHLELRTKELVQRQGMAPDEARERARREFGDLDAAKRALSEADEEAQRSGRRTAWLRDLRRDLAFAFRSLRRRPVFAIIVAATLALGIGGTTAVFSVVKAVLIESLPYEQADQLVRVYQYDVDRPEEDGFVAGPHFHAARENIDSFQDLAGLYTYAERGADLTVAGQPERVRVLPVASGYFRVLRQEPVRGRTFTRDEERGEPLAVISERLAARLGEADAGRSIELDGERYSVVGVIPGSFEDPVVGRVDVWTPLDLYGGGAQEPENTFLSVIARLAPDASVDRARQELSALDRALAKEYPEADNLRFRVVELQEDLVASARPTLLLFLGAIVLVLLIAAVNVANLMLVRSLERGREMAVRAALGAGGGRIARQLLTESVVLAAAGGLAGVGLAVFGIDALLAFGQDAIPRTAQVGLDGPVLGFAAALTLATGIGCGFAPALRVARTSPASTLRTSAGGSSDSRRQARVRGALVASQVGLALMLLVGASVLATSVYRLSRVDLGVRVDDVLTFELNLPESQYDASARAAFHREMTERLERLPGVSAVGATSRLPATGTYHPWGTTALSGPRAGTDDASASTQQRVVDGAYFDALDVPLLDGRWFDTRDGPNDPPVAVLSESAAEALFPGAPAVGQRIAAGPFEREVIGVVGDIALDPEGRPAAHVYHAHAQIADNRNWPLQYVVAARTDARALIPTVRAEIANVDPQLVMHETETLDEVLGRGRIERRFAFVLTSAFAGLALILAVLGLYGMLTYTVRQRTREIGIRIALGAEPRRVAAMIVGQGLRVTAAGLGLGTLGALALGRVLSSLVFRTQPADPLILAGVVGGLTLIALGVALLPAYRAMRVPPRLALAVDRT